MRPALFVVIALCVCSAQATQFLVLCSDAGHLCFEFIGLIEGQGHTATLVDGRPLSSSDFVGMNVFWDGTEGSSSVPCDEIWTDSTVQAVRGFLDAGGSWYTNFDLRRLRDCISVRRRT